MGGGTTGGYVQITLQTLLSEPQGNQLHRISQLLFTSAPVPGPEHDPPDPKLLKPDPSLTPGDPPVGKLGLGGLKPEDVDPDKFNLYARLPDGSLSDMGARQNKVITNELRNAFGGDWAGYAVTLAPAGGTFNLVTDITFVPNFKQKAKRPLQIIPVVMAFGTNKFVDHYLLSVIVAQGTTEKLDASVTQPYQ